MELPAPVRGGAQTMNRDSVLAEHRYDYSQVTYEFIPRLALDNAYAVFRIDRLLHQINESPLGQEEALANACRRQ